MREAYSDWEDMVADSARVHELLSSRSIINIRTPGIGLADTLQASTTIRSIEENYHPELIEIVSYHPELFYGNPRCIYAEWEPDPEVIVLDSWPPHKLPNGGIGYCGMTQPMPVTAQWDTRVGLYGIPLNTKQEFYPYLQEDLWGREIQARYGDYVVIHTKASPPRSSYNKYSSIPSSTSEARARTGAQIDWPVDRWVAVASNLRDMGYAVLQVGDGTEEKIGVDMTTVGVRLTFMVIKYAKLLIGQPSFPMFAANAMGTPILALWNGSYNSEIAQFGDINIIDHAASAPCNPCSGPKVDCGGYCMDLITVEEILGKVAGMIGTC
jgi:hypothetical protein